MLDDGGAGTGIGQYSRTLLSTLRVSGLSPLILKDGGFPARRSRTNKLFAAARTQPRRATVSDQGFLIRDVFREAQVFFDIYKRTMPVIVPGPPGIMHWSYPLPLRLVGWQNLYTVHDVMPLDPMIPSPVNGTRLRHILNAARDTGGRFVTVSQAARQKIAERLGWPEAAIACCHQAVDVADAEYAVLPAIFQRDGYLLYVGAIEARKNLDRLLEAYRQSGLATPLVISGPDGLNAASIDRLIAATPGAVRLKLQSRARTLQLIAHARALILVSLDEGFGLPVAEAMALETPVLASDVAALAEVAAGAALLVDPIDVTAMRDALVRIDEDATFRDWLRMRGLQRARYFALEPYARRIWDLYEELAQQAGFSSI